MKTLSAFLSGALFSVGLAVSGMTQPINIVGFLDFFGDWRPALLFVMVGALAVYAVLHRLVLKRRAPLFDFRFELPTTKKVDARLVAGSAAFGVGWGLGGICPGPALVTLGIGAKEAVIFFVAMLGGMVLYRLSAKSEGGRLEGEDACG